MQSKATTVDDYMAELPEDRRRAIQAVRAVILKNLDDGYEEGMQYGGIGYYVPHRVYPAGYHCDPAQPLCFAGLGSQKNHMSLGLMSNYFDSAEEKWFRHAWTKTGNRLDMGRCCVRFRKLEDVPLEVVGEAIRRMPVKKYIESYEKALASKRGAAKRKGGKPGPAPGRAAAKKREGGRGAGAAKRRAAR